VRLDPDLHAELRGLIDPPGELLDAHGPRRGGVLGPRHAGQDRDAADAELRSDAGGGRELAATLHSQCPFALVGRDLLHRLADREEEVLARQPVRGE
jgi:hypothetical protein